MLIQHHQDRVQGTFSGVNELFRWVEQPDGSFWYEFEPKDAQKWALRERNARAKEYAQKGWNVRKWSLGTQERTLGGIGTQYPEITVLAKAYGFDAWR